MQYRLTEAQLAVCVERGILSSLVYKVVPHLETLLYKAGIVDDFEPPHRLVTLGLLRRVLKPAKAAFTVF